MNFEESYGILCLEGPTLHSMCRKASNIKHDWILILPVYAYWLYHHISLCTAYVQLTQWLNHAYLGIGTICLCLPFYYLYLINIVCMYATIRIRQL